MSTYKDNDLSSDYMSDDEENDTEEIKNLIQYCVENMKTDNELTFSNFLERAKQSIKTTNDVATNIFLSNEILPVLCSAFPTANENQKVSITKLFTLLAATVKEMDEYNFKNIDLLKFIGSIVELNESIPILKNILDFGIYFAERDASNAAMLCESGFVEIFINHFNLFLDFTKKNEIEEGLVNTVVKTKIIGAELISCLFMYKEFTPDLYIEPLIQILFNLMESNEEKVKCQVLDSLYEAIYNKKDEVHIYYRGQIKNMIIFIKNNAENPEICVKMLDILYEFFDNYKTTVIDVHREGLIPFIVEMAANNSFYMASVGYLLCALTEDLYVSGRDLEFVFNYISILDGEEELEIKLACTNLFYSACVTNGNGMLEYILENNSDIVGLLCDIAQTQDLEACYNIFGGLTELYNEAKKVGRGVEELNQLICDNDIDEDFIDDLISLSEDNPDKSIRDCFIEFNKLMSGEDNFEYDPNYAPPQGYEF